MNINSFYHEYGPNDGPTHWIWLLSQENLRDEFIPLLSVIEVAVNTIMHDKHDIYRYVWFLKHLGK